MSILDGLTSQVQTTKEKEKAGAGSWVRTLVAGIFVAVVTAILGFVAWKRGKQLADAKHKLAVAEETKHKASVDARIEVHEAAKQEALDRAEEAGQLITAIEESIQKLEEEHNEARDRIDDITSWDDVDIFLGRNR